MPLLAHLTLWCWIAFWVTWVILWSFQKKTKWQQAHGKKLYYSLLLAIGAVFLLSSFNTTQNSFFPYWILIPHLASLMWIGFVLTLVGLLFAIYARITLGRNWSSSMDLKQNHQLVTTGPYALVRNPIYTGIIGMFIGSTLVVGTIAGIIGTLLAIWSCVIRVKAEEKLMREQFPDQYSTYAKRVKRLIPFLY